MPDSELSAGSVVALFIVECREAPMKKVEQLNALAGQGLEAGIFWALELTRKSLNQDGRSPSLAVKC